MIHIAMEATEGQHNNVSYQIVDIGADIKIEDVGQPTILVTFIANLTKIDIQGLYGLLSFCGFLCIKLS